LRTYETIDQETKRRIVLSYLSQSKDAKAGKAAGDAYLPAKGSSDVVTTIGHGVLVTGNIVCTGAVQIFGRVTGEIRASHVVISEGANVDGKVTVQEAVIQGTFKGTMHGNSVKLQGTAVVDGELFNKSLTIEQDAQFEGMSRRLDRPVESPSLDQVSGENTPVRELKTSPETAPEFEPA
jgi:cytoskeletal protein CcmA (bactofilin family)